MTNVLTELICFLLFVLIQSLAINGLKLCFDKEEIFYKVRLLLDRILRREWMRKPLYSCVKCMSSFWGGISFWSVVIPLFGYHNFEISIFIFDVFILVYLNYFIYKRI